MSEQLFCRNKNFMKSFFAALVQKNSNEPRWHFIVMNILPFSFSLVFFGLAYLVIRDGGSWWVILLPIALILFILILSLISYFLSLKFSSTCQINCIKFIDGEEGFWMYYSNLKDARFIAYDDVLEINMPQPTFGMVLISSISGFLTGVYLPIGRARSLFYFGFILKIRNSPEDDIIILPYDIERVLEAADRITHNISSDRIGNLRFLNGHVVRGLPAKGELGVNLETGKGKYVLVILLIVVMGFFIMLCFSISRFEGILNFLGRIFFFL